MTRSFCSCVLIAKMLFCARIHAVVLASVQSIRTSRRTRIVRVPTSTHVTVVMLTCIAHLIQSIAYFHHRGAISQMSEAHNDTVFEGPRNLTNIVDEVWCGAKLNDAQIKRLFLTTLILGAPPWLKVAAGPQVLI